MTSIASNTNNKLDQIESNITLLKAMSLHYLKLSTYNSLQSELKKSRFQNFSYSVACEIVKFRSNNGWKSFFKI